MAQYLRFDFYGSQPMLERILKHYNKFRNYYNKVAWRRVPADAGYYPLAQIIADAVNATLISSGHAEFSDDRHPMLLPGVLAIDGNNRTLPFIEKQYFQGNGERPSLIRSDPLDLNFVVCEFPVWERIGTWDLTRFLKTFDQWSAYLFVTAILLVSVTAFSSVRSGYRFAIFDTIQATISVGRGRKKVRSGVFILWMYILVILVPAYFGDIASKVIIPADEIRVNSFIDLEKQNYTIQYPGRVLTKFFADLLESLRGLRSVSPEIKTLGRLLQKTVRRSHDKDEIYKALIRNHEANIHGWLFVLSAMNKANYIMELHPYEERKKCYVGKKLVRYGDAFHVFLPPRSLELARVFKFIEQAGIVKRWIYEYQAAYFSERVQNRIKYKSPTNVKEEKRPAENLKLKGKIITIFVLWGTLLSACTLCFYFELCWHLGLSLLVFIVLDQIRVK